MQVKLVSGQSVIIVTPKTIRSRPIVTRRQIDLNLALADNISVSWFLSLIGLIFGIGGLNPAQTVYPTRNITSIEYGRFNLSSLSQLFWGLFFTATGVSTLFSLRNLPEMRSFVPASLLFTGIGLLLLIWNWKKFRRLGLLIELSSGSLVLFLCRDINGGTKIMGELCEFTESPTGDEAYRIVINNSHIRGNVIGGNANDVRSM